MGQGAGLVEDHRTDAGQHLKGLQAPHQDAPARQRPRSAEHGRRRRQRQRARAGDDEHRHRHRQRLGVVDLPPVEAGRASGQHHQHQKGRGDAVGQHGQAGFFGGRFFHQAHDLREPRVAAQTLHIHQHRPGQVEAAGHHGLTTPARDRVRLAGQQCLVHRGGVAEQRAVARKGLPGLDLHRVAHHQPPNRHAFERAIGSLPCAHLGQAVHQRVQCARGAVARLEFQVAPPQQEEHEHGHRIEPDLVPPGSVRIEGGGRTDQEGDQDAQRDRRVHTDATELEVAPGTLVERPTGKKHHGQREQPAGPAQQLVDVVGNLAGRGHVGGPRVHHHLHGAETRHKQTPQRLPGLFQALADRQRLLHRQQAVTCLPHHLRQPGHAGLLRVPAHRQAPRGRVHLGAVHAGQALQGAFHRIGAGSAIHALHHQHGLGRAPSLTLLVFGEVLLLDRIVEHGKVVGDGQRPAVGAKNAGGIGGAFDRERRRGFGRSHGGSGAHIQ